MRRERDTPPDGFKQTEIGLIPEEWEAMALEKAASAFYGGGTPSTNHPEYWGGDIHWTTSAYISGLYLKEGQKKITSEGLESSSTKLIPKGNLLIGTRVGVGKVAINQVDIAISQDLTGAIIDKSKFHPEFLAYYLLSESPQEIFQRQTRGTTIKGIPREDLRLIPVCCPPLPEQHAIAHILSKIQAAAQAQAAIAEQARELKRALMAKLFTEGLRGEPLKETAIGPMPEGWEVMRIKDHCEKPQYGYTESATKENVGPKFLRITDIQGSGVDWSTVPHCPISAEKLKTYQLREGDVLFARIGATTRKELYS